MTDKDVLMEVQRVKNGMEASPFNTGIWNKKHKSYFLSMKKDLDLGYARTVHIWFDYNISEMMM